jgi:hypothetical protein
MNTEEKALRKDLSKKLKAELLEDLVFYMKVSNAAKPIVEDAATEHISWKTLPFIPEDLGFKEYIADGAEKDEPELTIRVYHKDGVTCVKNFSGMWIISKGDMRMGFKIKSKFAAYQIFSGLGLKFSQSDSTVPDVETPISEIIKEGE